MIRTETVIICDGCRREGDPAFDLDTVFADALEDGWDVFAPNSRHLCRNCREEAEPKPPKPDPDQPSLFAEAT